MKSYTYTALVSILERQGANLAEVAVGRMMDIVAEETGRWPSWGDTAPEWVVRNCLGKAAE